MQALVPKQGGACQRSTTEVLETAFCPRAGGRLADMRTQTGAARPFRPYA